MKTLLMSLLMSFGIFAVAAHAQAPASAPAGSTGVCKDGTYTSADSKKGACRGHQGVKDWYAAAAAPATSASDTAPAKKSAKTKSEKTAAPASASTSAPAGSTGVCKDGSYTSADSKKGACRGHQGVKDWYGATAAAAPTSAPVAVPKSAPAPVPAPTSMAPAAPAPVPTAPAPTRAAVPATPATPAPRATAAGGGAGKVWVNTETKVYHCANDRYYGKTKQGEYMSEADAIAKGNHGSHGKNCTP